MLVLLQSSVGIVTEQDSLWPIPETSPRPVVEELGGDGTIGQNASHIHHKAGILFAQPDTRYKSSVHKQSTKLLAGNVPRQTVHPFQICRAQTRRNVKMFGTNYGWIGPRFHGLMPADNLKVMVASNSNCSNLACHLDDGEAIGAFADQVAEENNKVAGLIVTTT